jgi:hypothetical protein
MPRRNKGPRLRAALLALATTLLAACAPPQPAVPTVDQLATAVAQAAYDLLTQTAAAASPTPPPTYTLTPSPTDPPTPTSTAGPVKMPVILEFTGCWYGPGSAYTLESNISKGKRVELLGIGSVPGWYIIRNPYFHKPCWVQAAVLKIDPATDLSQYPAMTPGPP